MIVREYEGDLFDSHMQTLLNPVNVVGVMGKGLALAFRKRFPQVYTEYLKHFPKTYERRVHPAKGRRLYVAPMTDHQQCLLFPTKLHWKDPSPLGLVADNLRLLARDYQQLGIRSLALPLLGCGHGALDWVRHVRPLIYRQLDPLPIAIEIVLPL